MEETLNGREFLAHISEDGRRQLLLDHLKGTADLASEFASPFGQSEYAHYIGLHHDIGKYSKEFQRRLMGGPKVDHSTAGAYIAFQNHMSEGAFSIAGHHSGLPDVGSRTDAEGSTLWARMNKAKENRIPDFSDWSSEIDDDFQKQNRKMSKYSAFFRTHMLYSCLVDADYLDTERFMLGDVKRGVKTSLTDLERKLNQYIAPWLKPSGELNTKRCAILNQAIQKGKKSSQGLYSLTVPTGGGKTVTSLAFAINHALCNHLDRIIYVIPYTSIIEQTAEVFRKILGNENVLEHHSGVEYGEDEDSLFYMRSTENWDMPVIVTTAVQFFESIYKNTSSNSRRLHNVANSVIIFDEAQMMPVKYLRPTLMAIESLVKHFQCSVVMCSATQPNFSRFVQVEENKINKENFLALPFTEIMEEDKLPDMYKAFQRVNFKDEGTLSYDDIAQKMSAFEQVLCIAATKDEAKKVYEALGDNEVIYLSTNLCPVHRRKVIEDIRERLKKGKSCKVVSTSVISVGVDIDFPVVFLERVGLDSLIQGAGRCNREGKRKAKDSIVHIFDTDSWLKSKFMELEKSITSLFAKEYPEVDWGDPQAIEYYFNNLYTSKNLDIDILESNKKYNIIELTKKCSFSKIDEVYRIIEDNDCQVFIPFTEEGRDVEVLLRSGKYTRELMRRANQYIVSVRKYDYLKLREKGALDCLDGDFAILNDQRQYDKVTGLTCSVESGLITI